MGKKAGPPPPDMTAVAEKTAQSNNDQLLRQDYANRITQNNPWGTVSYSSQVAKNPDGTDVVDSQGKPVMSWTQNTQLTPEQDAANKAQMSIQRGRSDIAQSLLPQVMAQMSKGIDFSQFQPMAGLVDPTQTNATTNANGPGIARQNIDTSRMATPELQKNLDYGNLQGVADSSASRDTAYQQLMAQANSRLDPQWERQQQQMQTQLANQGIMPGSEAYTQAMANMGTTRNDAYNQAMMSAQNGATQQAQANYAIDMGLRQQQANEAQNQGNFYNTALGQMFGFGSQAAQQQLAAQNAAFQQDLSGGQFDLSRQNQAFNQGLSSNAQNFNQGLQAAGFQNQTRQQQIAEADQQRMWAFNALNALMNGNQVSGPQFANFAQAGMGKGTDYSGAAQAQFDMGMQNQQMQNQAIGQAMQGVSGMAGMFMMSDRRVKTDVRRIGRHPRGFGIYRYRFIGESRPRVGVMAQEVARVMPQAVRRINGVLAVNYSAL